MTRAGAELGAWIVGGVGMLGCAIGGALAPAQFPYAWLAAVTGWIGWPLGSLALILIHALIGGRWGLAIRPHLIAGIVTLPLLMPVLLPLLFVLHALYPWMHADVAAHLDNRFYLNAAFFYGRGVVYLTVWFGLAALVLRALCHENPEFILYRIAPPGLILLALTVTFAAFDYTLSMEPRFKSSIYGLLVGAESVLLALSAAVLGVTLAQPAERGETMRFGQATARIAGVLGISGLYAVAHHLAIGLAARSQLVRSQDDWRMGGRRSGGRELALRPAVLCTPLAAGSAFASSDGLVSCPAGSDRGTARMVGRYTSR